MQSIRQTRRGNSLPEWLARNERDKILSRIKDNSIVKICPRFTYSLKEEEASNALVQYLQALRNNTSVKSVDFSWLNVEDSLTGEIAELIKCNNTIEELNFSHTFMSNTGIRCLANTLKNNFFIVNLDLTGSWWEDQFSAKSTLKLISQYLERNRKNKKPQPLSIVIVPNSAPSVALSPTTGKNLKEGLPTNLAEGPIAEAKCYGPLASPPGMVFFADKSRDATVELRKEILSKYLEATVILKPKYKLFEIYMDESPEHKGTNTALINTLRGLYKDTLKIEHNKIIVPYSLIRASHAKNFNFYFEAEAAKLMRSSAQVLVKPTLS